MMGHIPSSAISAATPNKDQFDTVDDAAPTQDHEAGHTLGEKNSLISPSGSSSSSFFGNIRNLFNFPDSSTSCLTFEFRNWHTADFQCDVSTAPPDCQMDEETPIKAEPCQDGTLKIHTLVPKEFPGGKKGLFLTTTNFLRDPKTYGIQSIHMGDGAIESYLTDVVEIFKSQSKNSNRNKNKDSKGKAIKWKNPTTAFGCRYVWAHDNAMPHMLYFRVRPTCMGLPALVVVNTNKAEYKQELDGDKIVLPQIHIHLVFTYYQSCFDHTSQSYANIPGFQPDPSQPWWWNIIQHHNKQHEEHLKGTVADSGKSKIMPHHPTASAISSSKDPVNRPKVPKVFDKDLLPQRSHLLSHRQEESSNMELVSVSTLSTMAKKRKSKRKNNKKHGQETSDIFVTEATGSQQNTEKLNSLAKGKESEINTDLQEPSDTIHLGTHASRNLVPGGYKTNETAHVLRESNEPDTIETGSPQKQAIHSVSQPRSSPTNTLPNESAEEAHDEKEPKPEKKKSKKKGEQGKQGKQGKQAMKSENLNQEKVHTGEPMAITTNQHGIIEIPEDDTGWSVVSHAKRRQGLSKSRPAVEDQDHNRDVREHALPKARASEEHLPSGSATVQAPPPNVTSEEFPPLPPTSKKTYIPNHEFVDSRHVLNPATQPGPSDSKKKKGKGKLAAPIPALANPTVKSQPEAPGPKGPVGETPFIQLDSTGFKCTLPSCDKRCCSLDYTSVICPRCGPLSEIRYCSQEHLFADVKNHWSWCGQYAFGIIARGELPVISSPPLLPNLYNWDNPERHRQAVHHAVDRSGDYFVFSDWEDYIGAGQPADVLNIRCSTRVVHVVSFDNPVLKDRFHRILGVCLFMSPAQVEFLGYLFRMIRDKLREQGLWSAAMDRAVRYQMNMEFQCDLMDWYTGSRHACEIDWSGGNRRGCRDTLCQQEFQTLLGATPLLLEERMKNMEANFWLLRAHRHTHPSLPGMIEAAIQGRTRGEGFPCVLPEDERLFTRGTGWDWPIGDMEIEEPGF
ncbi:hypothetical protein BGW36DRAFT_450318 [Talaromyces proteolyticus]|uniref:Uncharacterized protein n=1 Tax=Talaromyces proteolyticus TaxID=1131652 RepID=A0AAD4PWB3_9EURO|nr:uncharacterized protein BGW36DRAFT_450318 [Talaromyces proteolyticus]KAH8697665.1 hypothetical protein BGW36DRAFT_450318 [Talaromyces proteolyticus]